MRCMRHMRPATTSALAGLAAVAALASAEPAAETISARWAYEDAYDNVNGGDWYRDDHNEAALLAWVRRRFLN